MDREYASEDEILEEELRQRLQKEYRRRSAVIFLVGAAVVLLILAALGLLVMKLFFSVNKVELTGDGDWTAEELMDACSVEKGDLMLFIDKRGAERSILSKYRMIESVSIERELPDKVVFSVKKEVPLFFYTNSEYSEPNGSGMSYIVVSQSEKIIEICSSKSEMTALYGNLPEVKMPVTGYAVLGEKIRYNEEGDSRYIPGIISALEDSFFASEDLVFDLRIRFDIVIYSGIADDGLPKYELRFGNYRRYEEKIRMAEIIARDKLEARFKGVISVETSGNDPVKDAYARAR